MLQPEDRGFAHRGPNGTYFECSTRTLRDTVYFSNAPTDEQGQIDAARFAADAGVFAAFHAVNIWPYLNGFAGYDTLRYAPKSE